MGIASDLIPLGVRDTRADGRESKIGMRRAAGGFGRAPQPQANPSLQKAELSCEARGAGFLASGLYPHCWVGCVI